MSKLLSCFWQSKKDRDYGDAGEGNGRRSRRLSKEKNEVVYVETGGQRQFNNNNVRTVYRTVTDTQSPQFEKVYLQDPNRQSRSYPVSPERRTLYKAYSFEQKPSVEKESIGSKDSRNSRSIMIYSADVNTLPRFSKNDDNSVDGFAFPNNNVTRRLTMDHDIDFEKELDSKRNQKCVAEKPAEDYYKSGTSNDHPDILNIAPKPKITAVLRARPQSSKNFALASTVKPMVYRAEGGDRSPSASRSKSKNPPPLLATADGKLLRPLSPESVKILSSPSNKPNQPVRLSIIRPSETVEGFPMAQGAEMVVAAPMITEFRKGNALRRPMTPDQGRILSAHSNKVSQPTRLSVVRPVEEFESFPLAQRGEMIVAAPMIGGGGGRKGKQQQQKAKPILRKGKGGNMGGNMGGNVQQRGRPPPQAVDDFDDFSEGEYGRGNYGPQYYDEGSDMYPFAPMDDPYSYGGRGGYYDDGYDEGYGYSGGRSPGYQRGGRGGRPQIYATQMPDTALPTSADKGKNPPFQKIGKASDSPDSCIDKQYYDMKSKQVENQEHLSKEAKVKMISSAQQTDIGNELDFICFSPDRCFKTSEVPDDPNAKLRWRIVIKRGDEE